ncbi:MAG: hypothetical protein ACRC8A_21395 [Microcoleaceae cyanobacterium]
MGLNSTVVLTVVLLMLMFGAGIFSSAWGYRLGREALKEITQPDVRPSNLTGKTDKPMRKEALHLLKEANILTSIKKQMEGGEDTTEADKVNVKNTVQAAKPELKSEEKAEQASREIVNAKLPIVSRDGGVTLEITSVSRRSNSLQFKVSMKNESDRSIRFLYSFLNVTDDKGRALSASVENLPGQLPPDRKIYRGEVSIPTALLENASELSLSLTDYPDQQLQLQVSGIPITQ